MKTGKKTKKLRRWLRDQLNNKWRAGFGKKKEKGVHNGTPYIHSESTYNTYLSQCNHFADWCLELGVKDKDVAYKMVPEYIKHLKSLNRSAWTIYTAISAIAKAYGVSTTVRGIKPPKRERADVKRSRYLAQRDSHFSEENNKLLVTFGNCTGLRRKCLTALHGNQLRQNEDGSYYLENVKGKGGKIRNVDILGSDEEIKMIVDAMHSADECLVFSHVHSAFDEHYHRSVYACRAYRLKARNIDDVPPKERYQCRKDRVGIVYDKVAMRYVSNQLGHNRIDVIAASYLQNL